MELKGTKDWSDFDSADNTGAKSKETPKVPPAEQAPERRAPLFDLGIIYKRSDMPSETLRAASLERDHVEPETAQGITLGTPELSTLKAAASAAAQAQLEALQKQSIEDDEDDDSTETEQQDRPTPQAAPAPAQPAHETTRHEPVDIFEQFESAPLPAPAEAVYYPPAPVAAEAPPPASPDPRFAEQAIPTNPVELFIEQPIETPPLVENAGGNNMPPPPPPEHPSHASGPDPAEYWRGNGEPSPAPYVPATTAYNTYRAAHNPNLVTQRTMEASLDELRRKMAARMIVVAALTWYFARRPIKPLREQVKKLQQTTQEQNEQLARLNFEQQAAQARLGEQQRQIEQFTAPQSPTVGSEVVQQVYPQMTEAPVQHVERAGNYNVVVDEHNQVVQGAQGQEYQRDRAHERMPSPFGAQDAGSAAGYSQPMTAGSGSYSLPSGQLPPDHALMMNGSGQTPNEEAQHLLDGPKPNPVVTALTSPWLWLGVGMLLIAFFAAATI